MAIPVLTIDQIRLWEKTAWESGISQHEVIQMAGSAVAEQAMKLTKPGDSIIILAGKGHNGDDARLAGSHISDRKVTSLNIFDPEFSIHNLDSCLTLNPDLLIDGLFGIGLNRQLAAPWLQIIDRINNANIPILAVDVPSGLNADTGETFGSAVRANCTVTMGAVKRGFLNPKSSEFTGKIIVADQIGLPLLYSTQRNKTKWNITNTNKTIQCDLAWLTESDFRQIRPDRPLNSHKGTFGHLFIVAGSFGFHGASVLAAKGASRARPGLVTLMVQPEVYIPVATQLQSVMVCSWQGKITIPESATAILIGPGLADPNIPENFKQQVIQLWKESPLPVIVDASALDWLKPGRCKSIAPRVITPHPGEAARMLNMSVAEIQADRPLTVRKLSTRFSDCYVVLKGYLTLIGKNKGVIYVNPTGNPNLAQGGSGDLLAGFIAGLLAQPQLQKNNIQKSIAYAVWAHGLAADKLELIKPNWTIDELANELI